MSKKITVHYYSINSNIDNLQLHDVLLQLDAMNITQRTRTINKGDIKLELVEKHGTDWFLHFTAARLSNWPGVGKKGQASNDLVLGLDTELTENTYAAFDSQTGIMVLQYTQSAVRASRMFAYFDAYTNQPNSFSYYPVLNNDALIRYANKYAYTEIEAVIDNVTAADAAHFQGSTIASSVRESVQAGITRVSVKFNVNARARNNKIPRGFVQGLADLVLQRAAPSDKLVVTGRDGVDSPLESIDLLEDVKTAKYPERSVTLTPGRRYRPDDMRRILFDALKK